MFGVQWFARNGDEITMEQWGQLHADLDYIVVAKDRDETREVSTVWIGLPQVPFTADPPLIFETMIFAGDDDEMNTACWRYPTEAAALAGHDQVCAAYLRRKAPRV